MLRSRLHLLAIGGLTLGFAALAFLAAISYRPIWGLRTQIILSGSMRPALQPGSLVVTRQMPPWQYGPGDVVTFRAPFQPDLLTTHRLVRIYRNQTGALVVETKGDANPEPDPTVTSAGYILGKQVLVIPWFGFVLRLLKTQLGFLVFSLMFFLFFIWGEVRWWVRELKVLLGAVLAMKRGGLAAAPK